MMKDLRRSVQRRRLPEADMAQEQGTRCSPDVQDEGICVLVASGSWALINLESGHKLNLTLHPDM